MQSSLKQRIDIISMSNERIYRQSEIVFEQKACAIPFLLEAGQESSRPLAEILRGRGLCSPPTRTVNRCSYDVILRSCVVFLI
jgi:hypothetical protein